MSKYCTGAKNLGHLTQSCCKDHDDHYAPGSVLTRLEADSRLMVCVAQRGMPWRAVAMFLAVRAGGWVRWYWARFKVWAGLA